MRKRNADYDFKSMSDQELVDVYNRHLAPEHHSILFAGLAAGELTSRGYDFVIDGDGNEVLVKVNGKRKVA